MNTNIINAELALALRKCLPFVRRHAIISGGDGSLTYAFAVRALADADARQQEGAAVKRIVEVEKANAEYQRNRKLVVRGSVIVPGGPNDFRYEFPNRPVVPRRDAVFSGAEAKNQAARAVRPMPPSLVGGYAPATPPAKNCTCDTCTRYRRSTLNFYKD